MSVKPLYKKTIQSRNHFNKNVLRSKEIVNQTVIYNKVSSPINVLRSNKRVSQVSTIKNSSVLSRIFVFTLISAITCCFCCLGGHTLMEKARREGIRAIEKTKEMKTEVAYLRNRVDKYSDMVMIDQWACARGFIATDVIKPKQIIESQKVAFAYKAPLIKEEIINLESIRQK